METEDLNRESTLHLPIGHLLVVWDVLSNRITDTNYKDIFSEEEKMAIYALEDMCEKELTRNGYGSRPQEDWDQLMRQAAKFVKTIPVEFMD